MGTIITRTLHLACSCSIRTVVENGNGGRFYCLEHGSQNVLRVTTEERQIGAPFADDDTKAG